MFLRQIRMDDNPVQALHGAHWLEVHCAETWPVSGQILGRLSECRSARHQEAKRNRRSRFSADHVIIMQHVGQNLILT